MELAFPEMGKTSRGTGLKVVGEKGEGGTPRGGSCPGKQGAGVGNQSVLCYQLERQVLEVAKRPPSIKGAVNVAILTE